MGEPDEGWILRLIRLNMDERKVEVNEDAPGPEVLDTAGDGPWRVLRDSMERRQTRIEMEPVSLVVSF